MAQAMFDDHPIELYLRESGEVPELMPGGLDEFAREPTHGNVPYDLHAPQGCLPRLFNTLWPVLDPIFTGFRRSSALSEFAERFKYIVISSALLSPSLSTSSISRVATPTTPGDYPIQTPRSPAVSPPVSSAGSHIPTYTLAFLVPLALMGDGGLDFPSSIGLSNGEGSWTSTLDCLEALITANNAWDNVVTEALSILEAEEHSAFPSPSTASSLPSIRIALSSSLHTIETQCDNVRQLLSALTSPLVLSQLSHMYAPPFPSPSRMSVSPKRSHTMSLAPPSSGHSHIASRSRPLSLSSSPDDAYTRSRAGPASRTSLVDKRSTWSGSYALAHGLSRRLRGRRPSQSAVIRVEDFESLETPTFYSGLSHGLSRLSTPAVVEDVLGDADAEDEPFGIAALDLRRRRRMRVPFLNAPSLPSNIADPFSESSPLHASHGPLLTASLGSTFTSLSSPPSTLRQTSHIPLSKLHLALQGALGSKRFACAHLLALKFSDNNNLQTRNHLGSDVDGEDESYWEDVRSVISLLTLTLEDASARLEEALADRVRKQEQEYGVITDEDSGPNLASYKFNNNNALPSTFAPMPSHLTRFVAHINAITSALDDARDHLHQCVASLEENAEITANAPENTESPTPMALQSYERMRRELGIALRECERGRGTLLEIVTRSLPEGLAEGGDEKTPIHQEEHFSSRESDKTLYNTNEEREPKEIYLDQDPHQADDDDDDDDDDDATFHLIRTATSQHLPPPGIEQVFESVSAAAQPFVRERSKLTREERIRMAKARRESQLSSSSAAALGTHEGEPESHHPRGEKWGPGGEVVQELKDVIWQVNERRRKMIERSSLTSHSDALHSPT